MQNLESSHHELPYLGPLMSRGFLTRHHLCRGATGQSMQKNSAILQSKVPPSGQPEAMLDGTMVIQGTVI